MNYEELVCQAEAVPLFGDDLLDTFVGSRQQHHLQCCRWVKEGKLIRLKRGLYTLPETRRKVALPRLWLANALYSPSYVSLEYVLSLHDLIPERVDVVTSVTTRKTKKYTTRLGTYDYHHLERGRFFGFEEIREDEKFSALVALPEKALLDWIYFRHDWEPSEAYLKENLRLQNWDQLRKSKIKSTIILIAAIKVTYL